MPTLSWTLYVQYFPLFYSLDLKKGQTYDIRVTHPKHFSSKIHSANSILDPVCTIFPPLIRLFLTAWIRLIGGRNFLANYKHCQDSTLWFNLSFKKDCVVTFIWMIVCIFVIYKYAHKYAVNNQNHMLNLFTLYQISVSASQISLDQNDHHVVCITCSV